MLDLTDDQSGLVYGFVFPAHGCGQPVDTGGALRWLAGAGEAAPAAGERGFAWLNFNGANAHLPAWLRRHLAPPEEFLDTLKDGLRSARVEQAHDTLVAVINDVVYDPLGHDSLQVSTLWMHVHRDHLVTVRTRPLRSVERLRQAANAGVRFSGPLAVLVHLMRDQADVLVQINRTINERLDTMEDGIFAGHLPDRAVLGTLRRDLVRLQRLLAPEPAALFRLLNHPPAWASHEDVQDLQQSSEEFSVVLRDMAGLQERIKLLQEEVVSLVGERTNRSVFTLTAVTVIALPINLTAGLFGMNVGGIPLSTDSSGFWLIVGVLVAVTGFAAWALFRSQR